jgi:hypothetical protein
MGYLKSGHIKVVDETDEWYKYQFGLYNEDTNIPIIAHNIAGSFQNMTFQYYIVNPEEETGVDFGNCEAEIFMVANLSFDRLNMFFLLSKNNDKKLLDKVEDKRYSFEIMMDNEKPLVCALIVDDDRLRRAEKLKKIKDKING